MSTSVTRWPFRRRCSAVHAPNTPAPITAMCVLDAIRPAFTTAGDKATPLAPTRSERRVNEGSGAPEGSPLPFFIALTDQPRSGSAGGGGGGGGGQVSVARITEP